MGSKAEPERPPPKLPLSSMPLRHSPQPLGLLTPPFYAIVSVPFQWEEEPGKPRPCTDITTLPEPTTDITVKCLELPPRLFTDPKLPLASTVVEGSYMGRQKFQFFYGNCSHAKKGLVRAMVLKKKCYRERGCFCSLRRKLRFKGNTEIDGQWNAFSPSTDGESGSSSSLEKGTRNLPTFSHARSQFWANVGRGLKQGMPWNWKSEIMKMKQ